MEKHGNWMRHYMTVLSSRPCPLRVNHEHRLVLLAMPHNCSHERCRKSYSSVRSQLSSSRACGCSQCKPEPPHTLALNASQPNPFPHLSSQCRPTPSPGTPSPPSRHTLKLQEEPQVKTELWPLIRQWWNCIKSSFSYRGSNPGPGVWQAEYSTPLTYIPRLLILFGDCSSAKFPRMALNSFCSPGSH